MRKLVGLLSLVYVLGLYGACGGSGGSGSPGSAGKGGAGTSGGAGTTGGAGTSGTAGTTGGAGTGADGGAGTGAAGAMACGTDQGSNTGDGCNTAVLSGECVHMTYSSDTPPHGAGGMIEAGTYNLTSSTFYGAADAGDAQIGDRRLTMVVSSVTATSFVISQVQASGTRIDRSSGTVTLSDKMATYTPTCPDPADGGDKGGSAEFTYSGGTLLIIESHNDGTRVDTYTKS
jgi:hypothetical protein